VDISTQHTADQLVTNDPVQSAVARQDVLVRELTSADRDCLLPHFLALSENDRLLRFGQIVPNSVIENYVRGIDFARDAVFGVYGDHLELLGVGHLGYLPGEDTRTAELGISVLQSARGRTIGSKLFERAAIHCRNTRVTVLYMQCLSRNATMMHIAKKAGMQIEYVHGEADAFLTLPSADQSSIVAEMLQEQAALFDYAMKHYARGAAHMLEAFRVPPYSAG